MILRDLAHSRAGDKGDVCNVSVIAYNASDYDYLRREVTVERVREHLSAFVGGEIIRYELSQIGALNFVMHGALGGGVTRSLALDRHGKSLSGILLGMRLPMPATGCADGALPRPWSIS